MSSNLKNKIIELREKAIQLLLIVKPKPLIGFGIAAFVLVLVLLSVILGGDKSPPRHPLRAEVTVPFEEELQDMSGVKESVDPRDVWTSNISKKVEDTKDEFVKSLEEQKQQASEEINSLKGELEEIKALFEANKVQMERRELEESLRLSNSPDSNVETAFSEPKKSVGFFQNSYSYKRKNIRDYITSGSFARAVLLTGVVVGTGSNSVSNPEPVMLRLTDAGIFSKNKRTEQIKEAILIGDCSGNLSSERAKCRLQTLSLENMKGEIVERPVKGWIVGEDGRNGIKGMIVDKSSDLLRMAMLNGLLGGMSNFFQSQSSKGVFPVSPITGQQNALKTTDMLKSGAASGASDAFSKIADFIMERFNAMSPQIVIASGREVDVVFQSGVDLKGEESSLKEVKFGSNQEESSDGNLSSNSSDQYGFDARGANDAFGESMSQISAQMRRERGGSRDGF